MLTTQAVRATIVALALALLSGCAGIGFQSPITFNKTATAQADAQVKADPKPAPAQAASPAETPAPASTSTVPQFIKEQYVMRVDKTEEVLKAFPTSKATATAKWKVAHESGFTGSHADACTKLGLTDAQCKQYADMHSAGKCVVVTADNTAVLDLLTFTKDGKHLAQKNVGVAVPEADRRKAEVCHLGDGVYVGRFHFCGNHFRVNGDPLKVVDKNVMSERDKPNPAYVAPAKTTGPCGGSQFRTITVMVWNPSSFTDAHTQKFAGALREAETQGRGYRGDQFSRAMGKELRASGLPTASIDAQVRVFAVSPETAGTANGVGELLGTVTVSGGKGQINVPVGVASTRVLRFEFPDDGFSSPLKSPGTGKRDLLVFPHDDQRTPDKRWADYACAPFVHAAVVKK